ncbi:YoaK family protein [soil metagenome]
MTSYDRRRRLLAIALALQAGFVDALGFLQLGGYFVSFMSGNSTRLAVDLGVHRDAVWLAAAIVAAFVSGVMLGSLVRRSTELWPMTAVLAFVFACIVLAGLVEAQSKLAAIVAMTIAMGAVNATFERGGETGIGVTYVTGALVKSAQLLVSAFFGGNRSAWLWQAMLWVGLVIGALLGGMAFAQWQLGSLWIVVVLSGILAACANCIERRSRWSVVD